MRLLIREFREELALTQTELADKVGTLQRNISNWENGISEPDCETIVKIADTFGIKLDELFGREPIAEGFRSFRGVDRQLINLISQFSETQKNSLLQFLKDFGK